MDSLYCEGIIFSEDSSHVSYLCLHNKSVASSIYCLLITGIKLPIPLIFLSNELMANDSMQW